MWADGMRRLEGHLVGVDGVPTQQDNRVRHNDFSNSDDRLMTNMRAPYAALLSVAAHATTHHQEGHALSGYGKEGAALLVQRDVAGIGVTERRRRIRGLRRLHLSRIDYFILYRVCDRTLEVLAFWHTRHGSQPKL
jgi:hypothetical protein